MKFKLVDSGTDHMVSYEGPGCMINFLHLKDGIQAVLMLPRVEGQGKHPLQCVSQVHVGNSIDVNGAFLKLVRLLVDINHRNVSAVQNLSSFISDIEKRRTRV